ncbi:hypothetical protein HanXRQr2_Chr12g0527751 [Helianthus annuus]|uniref:Uncharacterized protein n=1 Tax=Helianthus annuus TaxID=4232 RepID=A0A9K3ENP3_HELAN|nr:hypothetical protein HanXRQr2_Chr12g0527751 [Helianthus annuus]
MTRIQTRIKRKDKSAEALFHFQNTLWGYFIIFQNSAFNNSNQHSNNIDPIKKDAADTSVVDAVSRNSTPIKICGVYSAWKCNSSVN